MEKGVPQGTILGVLLFIIYINDMEKVLKNCKLILFADDGLLYISEKHLVECENKINNDLKEIDSWLKMSKPIINTDRTKYMLLNSPTAQHLSL